MFFWLAEQFAPEYSFLNVFRYITLRGILATLTALIIVFVVGPGMIRWLTRYKIGQTVRTDGPESHIKKAGTPTMGGALILIAVAIATLLWADLGNRFVWVLLFTTMSFGAIGWWDDYLKLARQDPRGIGAKAKYFWQTLAGGSVALFLYATAQSPAETSLIVPFFKDVVLPLSPTLFVLLTYLVIVGSSNAVNLTDGLDGLAILPTVLVAGALAIFAYLTGHVKFSEYLSIPHVVGAGETLIFLGAMVGAGLGFLWFNAYPAMVFMGDIGALALGAALGAAAVVVRQEIVLFVMGGVFVIETISVMLQVASFKLTGKRIFRMAPLHHHFEKKGWHEAHVVVRFWIITFILVLVGLATLKLR